MLLAARKQTSALTPDDLARIRECLGGQQPFSTYFNAALVDLARGIDNRWFQIDDNGLIMGIDFQEIQVVTIIGDVCSELIEELCHPTKRTEFHVSEEHAAVISNRITGCVIRPAHLNYYVLNISEPFEVDATHIKLLTPADIEIAEQFYNSFYESRIFSPWMLEQPFVGLFIDNQLVSAGGTIIKDEQCAAANIGNFLTHPSHRGRKYSQTVVKSLINALLDQEITRFMLGTTADNLPACRAYESVGFQVYGRRIQLEVVPNF